MANESKTEINQSQSMTDSSKGWVMVALTLIFILLYIAALFGLIAPLKDVSIITRLEPIIFVIIGYYFGRLPAQANENTLKNEINRQSQKATAAQQIKENLQQEREILEEKIKNAKIALVPQASVNLMSENAKTATSSTEMIGNTKQAIETAVKILDS
jgi:choline-glycine betaine transporter